MVARGPNLQHAVLARQDPAQEVPTIIAFRELFLKDRLHNRASITAVPPHFQDSRSHKQLEGHHGGNGIPRQPERQLTLDLPERQRLPRAYGKLPKVHLRADVLEHRLGEIRLAQRHTAG